MVYAKSRDWLTAAAFIKKAKAYRKKFDFRRSLNYKLNATMDVIMQEENKEFKR